MKRFIVIIAIIIVSCSASKKADGLSVISHQQDINDTDTSRIPGCIKKMIGQYKSEDKQNPPRKIVSYLYKGKTVYYVTPPCCDFFSDLYDSSCVLIGHPDGGFTGRGDGSIPDFSATKTNEKLIWKDERK